MIRYSILFKGRVQGVGFRYTALKVAQQYALTGFVRNCSDGSVLVEIQGNPINPSRFIQSLCHKNLFIRIDDSTITEKPVILSEKAFNIVG